jgi:hypothetical protein
MHYGEMPRVTLGSSDLRSQVAIFGEWNIYGTRKILLLNFKPVTRIWKKLLVNERQNNVTSCTNCPYPISTFIPLDVDKFGAVCFFYCFSTFCQMKVFFKYTKLRKITKLRTSYEVTNIVRSYEKGTKRLRDSNATYRDNLLWRIVMHYGEMPRVTLGSSSIGCR